MFGPGPRPAGARLPSRSGPERPLPGACRSTARSAAAAASRSSAGSPSGGRRGRRPSLVLYVGAGGVGVVAGRARRHASRSSSRASRPRPSRRRRPPSSPRRRRSSRQRAVHEPGAGRSGRDRDLGGWPATPTTSSASTSPSRTRRRRPIDEKPLAPTPTDDHPGHADRRHQRLQRHARRPGGESESSPLVRWVLDTEPAGDQARVAQGRRGDQPQGGDARGRTQGGRRSSPATTKTGDSIAGTAAGDGTFALSVPLTTGSNPIRITATDPAGNDNAMS